MSKFDTPEISVPAYPMSTPVRLLLCLSVESPLPNLPLSARSSPLCSIKQENCCFGWLAPTLGSLRAGAHPLAGLLQD